MKRKKAAELLDVDLHATREEIDRKFRKKSRSVHPDHHGDASTEDMATLATAKHLLRENAEICEQNLRIVDIRTRVTPGEVFSGEVTFTGRCSLCKGMGVDLPDEPEDCSFCAGNGVIYPSKSEKMQCVQCCGTGAAFKREYICSKCNGKKMEEVKTHLRFEVPQKIMKGQLLFKKAFGGRNGVKEIHILSE